MNKRKYTKYWMRMKRKRVDAARKQEKKLAVLRWFRMTPAERARDREFKRMYAILMEHMGGITKRLLAKSKPLEESCGKRVEWARFQTLSGPKE